MLSRYRPELRATSTCPRNLQESSSSLYFGSAVVLAQSDTTMDPIARFKRQYAYNHWANHELAAGVLAMPGDTTRAVKVLNHIAGAERLWQERLHGDLVTAVVWPDGPASSIPAQFDAIHATWM